MRLLMVDFAITVGFLIVAVTVLLQARGWPFRAGVFPLVTSLVLLGLVLLKLVLDLATALRKTTAIQREGPVEKWQAPAAAVTNESPSQPPRPELGDELIDIFATASRAQWISAFGWMACFFVMLWLLGALVTVPLFALVYLLVASRESAVLASSYALVSWLFVYGLFDQILHIPLPRGVLLTGLGL